VPITTTNVTGDGFTTPMLRVSVELPDSGSVLGIQGTVQLAGQPTVNVSGSPLAIPPVPGSGSTFWNVQVDANTGVATIQTSSIADPAPITPTSLIVFRQRLDVGATTVNDLIATDSTPSF